jgi:crotonobetainyl-CoA:carnitine CoA-transferase CaiB-like acyl-CoA transferase
MIEEGMATPYLEKLDWDTFDMPSLSREDICSIEEPTERFFMTYSMKDLYNEALKRDVEIYPASNVDDILLDIQLLDRDFWQKVEYPELAKSPVYPGPFVKSSLSQCQLRGGAPSIGQHNREVYTGDLGFTETDLVTLEQQEVI